MMQLIPARIENGQVVPMTALPEAGTVRSVSILVEVEEVARPSADAMLPRLLGLLKADADDPRQAYREYLQGKYR